MDDDGSGRDYYVRQHRGGAEMHFRCLNEAVSEAKRRHHEAKITNTEPVLYVEGLTNYMAFMIFGEGFVRAFGLDKPLKRKKAKTAGA